MTALVLATASEARIRMFAAVGLDCVADPARVDEEAVRASMTAEGEPGARVADAIAQAKAIKVSARHAGHLVVAGDQVLVCDGRVIGKAGTVDEARDQLTFISGKTHELISAAVVARDGEPLWRHAGRARMTMHALTAEEIDGYLARAWDRVRAAVGLYHIEEDGARLFARVVGDPFVIQGFPLVELLTWLRLRGDITA